MSQVGLRLRLAGQAIAAARDGRQGSRIEPGSLAPRRVRFSADLQATADPVKRISAESPLRAGQCPARSRVISFGCQIIGLFKVRGEMDSLVSVTPLSGAAFVGERVTCPQEYTSGRPSLVRITAPES